MRHTLRKLSLKDPSSTRTKIFVSFAAIVLALSLSSSASPAVTATGESDRHAAAQGHRFWGGFPYVGGGHRSACANLRWFKQLWRHNSSYPSSALMRRYCTRWTPETPTPTPTPTATGGTPTPTMTTPTPMPTTPRPSPTVTPSTPPDGGPPPAGGCAAEPRSCGFPDETNTGVAAGIDLRAVPGELTEGPGWRSSANGSVTVDGDNTVLENVIISGAVDVTGDNVTIRNVRIVNDGDAWAIGMRRAANTTITDTEILPKSARLEVGIKDVYGDATGTKITRTEIARTATGIQTAQGLIEDNYIHDLAFREGDHVNGTTSNGSGTPLTIRHNTIFNPQSQTDAISLFQDFGVEANRTVEDNLLAGGGYTIYGGDGQKGTSSNIVIRNNRISKRFFPRGGSYGPVTAFDPGGPGNVWSGNVWDDAPDVEIDSNGGS